MSFLTTPNSIFLSYQIGAAAAQKAHAAQTAKQESHTPVSAMGNKQMINDADETAVSHHKYDVWVSTAYAQWGV